MEGKAFQNRLDNAEPSSLHSATLLLSIQDTGVLVALQEMATFHSLQLVFPYETKKTKKDLADVVS